MGALNEDYDEQAIPRRQRPAGAPDNANLLREAPEAPEPWQVAARNAQQVYRGQHWEQAEAGYGRLCNRQRRRSLKRGADTVLRAWQRRWPVPADSISPTVCTAFCWTFSVIVSTSTV